MVPQRGETIGLTIAGMASLDPLPELAELFLALMSALVDAQRRIRTTSSAPVDAAVTRDECIALIDASGVFAPGILMPPAAPTQLRELMSQEPATWGLVRGDDEWSVELRPQLRRFRDIRTVSDYVDRTWTYLGANKPPEVRAFTSALSLPEAIDYLDVVWRLRFGQPLFAAFGATAGAKLGSGCSTQDEFDSRMSALADVLGHIKVPDPERDGVPKSPGSLERLRMCLVEVLPDERHERIALEIGHLKDLARIRAGAQHRDAAADAAARYLRLDLDYPPRDLDSAWRHLSARAVSALNAIREEVRPLASDD
jgi:hypothetical protein